MNSLVKNLLIISKKLDIGLAAIIKYLLSLYQKTHLFGSRCRYYPSCSTYAGEAVEKHGMGRGLALALGRLLRCNQYFKGGYDPVP